jgi:hypothetical protein
MTRLNDQAKHIMNKLGYCESVQQTFELLPSSTALVQGDGVCFFWEKNPTYFILSLFYPDISILNALLSMAKTDIINRGGKKIVFFLPDMLDLTSSFNCKLLGEFVLIEHKLIEINQINVITGVHVQFESFQEKLVKSLIQQEKIQDWATSLSSIELLCLTKVFDDSFITCRQGDKLLGFMVSHEGKQGEMWLRKLYVSFFHRQKNFSRYLIEFSLIQAALRGMNKATGIVRRKMWDSGFCRNMGFKATLSLHLYEIIT